MSIAELFYPKELKQVIADLRSKDDLNEQALETFKKDILKKKSLFLIASVVCLLMFFYTYGQPVAYLFLLFSPFALFGCLLPVTSLNKYVLPYSTGIKTTGEVIGAHYDFLPSHGYTGWSIKYKFFDQNNIVRHGTQAGAKAKDLDKGKIDIGDEVQVFYLASHPDQNALYLRSEFQKFSLKSEV